jgi:uncharacterized cysteine cluster protein YcgN (CxxCxxCC family)
MGSAMPIPYCSVHKRLFHQQRNAWINRSQAYIDMLKRVCDILDAAEIDCSDYKVIETTCDQCVEIARQILHEQWEKRDPPQ